MMEVDERLEKLERSHRRLKYVLAGVTVVALALAGLAAVQERSGDAAGTLKARRFVLLDGEGRTRAALAMQDGSPELAMKDAEGTIRMTLTPNAFKLWKNGTTLRTMLRRDGLQVRDKAARPGAFFGMMPTGPGLVVRGPRQTRRVELGQIGTGSTGFVLRDEQGRVLSRLP